MRAARLWLEERRSVFAAVADPTTLEKLHGWETAALAQTVHRSDIAAEYLGNLPAAQESRRRDIDCHERRFTTRHPHRTPGAVPSPVSPAR